MSGKELFRTLDRPFDTLGREISLCWDCTFNMPIIICDRVLQKSVRIEAYLKHYKLLKYINYEIDSK